LLIVGGTLGALVAAGAIEPSTIAPSGWLRQPLLELSWLDGASEAAAIMGILTVAVAGVALLTAELSPLRVRYMAAGNGTYREFAVREGAVERMVRYAAAEVEGVRVIERASVRRREHGLEIRCTAILEPEALAGPLAPLLEARLCNAVYSMTGLPVEEVRLRLRHAEPVQDWVG
jgi:hypothetical protein